uniref:Uncharacterized protein n=1 Tax=Oryza barthii TaxID=65489 RepID=A0A0D3GJY2_9ORYZ
MSASKRLIASFSGDRQQRVQRRLQEHLSHLAQRHWFGMGGVGTCRDGTIVTKFPGRLDQRTGSRNVYMDELFVNHGGHRACFAAPSPELCHPWKDGGSIDKGKMVVKSHLARSRRPDSTPVIMEEEN